MNFKTKITLYHVTNSSHVIHTLHSLHCLHYVACIRLETALNAGCQLREDVEWAKYRSNNACVRRRGDILSLTFKKSWIYGRPWDNYRLCIVVERTACGPIRPMWFGLYGQVRHVWDVRSCLISC